MSTKLLNIAAGSVIGASLLVLAQLGPAYAQADTKTPAATESPAAPDSAAKDEPGLIDFASEDEPPAFDKPEQVVDAFKAALAANDFDGVAKLFGLDVTKLKASPDARDTFNQMREAADKRVHVDEQKDMQIVELGKQLWPVPFPIVKGDDGKWAFDTYAGIDEIIDRRVGENEIETIDTLRALADAQEEYKEFDRDDDGVLEYAQKLISTPGKTDGLYWPDDQEAEDSPAGEIADDSQAESVKSGDGYFGYRYRILTGQGDNILGGKQDYLVNGNLTGGYAIVAWPVTYAETGVSTFVMNKDGVVYQKDLGPDTVAAIKELLAFDPDDSWELADD